MIKSNSGKFLTLDLQDSDDVALLYQIIAHIEMFPGLHGRADINFTHSITTWKV